MSHIYLEDGFEEVFISFIEGLGYKYIPHQEIVRDSMKSPIASEILEESLRRINPSLTADLIDQAIYKLICNNYCDT